MPAVFFAVVLGEKVIPAAAAKGTLERFDRAGAVRVFVGLASLPFTVSEGQEMGWPSLPVLCPALLAVSTLGWFARHELLESDPLLDFTLFRNRNFLFLNLLLSVVFFSFAGINYLLVFYLKYVRGFSTSAAGLVLNSLSFAMMGAGILAGILLNRTGPKALCIAAGAALTSEYFLIMQLRPGTMAGYIMLCLALIGFGLGLVITPVSNMILNSVARSRQGMISGLTSPGRFAPITLGASRASTSSFGWGSQPLPQAKMSPVHPPQPCR